MSKIVWSPDKGWHDNGAEVTVKIVAGRIVFEKKSEPTEEKNSKVEPEKK